MDRESVQCSGKKYDFRRPEATECRNPLYSNNPFIALLYRTIFAGTRHLPGSGDLLDMTITPREGTTPHKTNAPDKTLPHAHHIQWFGYEVAILIIIPGMNSGIIAPDAKQLPKGK